MGVIGMHVRGRQSGDALQSLSETLRELNALLCKESEAFQLHAGHCRNDFRHAVIATEYRSRVVFRHVVNDRLAMIATELCA